MSKILNRGIIYSDKHLRRQAIMVSRESTYRIVEPESGYENSMLKSRFIIISNVLFSSFGESYEGDEY